MALAGALMAAIGIALTAAEAQAGWPAAGPLLYACGVATVFMMLLSVLPWRAAAAIIHTAVGLYAVACIAIPLAPLQLQLLTLTAAAISIPGILRAIIYITERR